MKLRQAGGDFSEDLVLDSRSSPVENPDMHDELHESTHGPDDGLRIVRFGDLHEPRGDSSQPGLPAPLPIRHPELAGGSSGLDRIALLDALETLRTLGVAIAWIDVVRAVCDRPEYTLERRTYERGMGEPFEQWCRRSQHMARDFVVTFADPGDGSVRFVLATAEDEGLRKAA